LPVATQLLSRCAKTRKKVAMRNILRTSTNQNVAGNCQDRLFVVGTVDVRAGQPMRTRFLYQHATQAWARLLEAFERHLMPAMAQALTPAAASSSSQPGTLRVVAAPRCWQRIKSASQHASFRQS
jgi:NAD-dependent oxidoreductase involved in siderophore biosynthesis